MAISRGFAVSLASASLAGALVAGPVVGPVSNLPGAHASAGTDPGIGAGIDAGIDVAAVARAADAITIKGRGYGHGHGLSQYGAEGAARQGVGWKKILTFYYPRTSFGTRGGKVRVLISADTTKDVQVKARSGLVARQVGRNAKVWKLTTKSATRWRIVPGTVNRLQWRGADGWVTRATSAKDLEFDAGGAPIRLLLPAGSATYRGVLRSAGQQTVNVLKLETYLRGVVPREIPALWHTDAVRAQAVAARTYAAYLMAFNTQPHYDLCDTSACQVYAGASAEHQASDAAIKATKKVVVTKAGEPIFAQFSASNGGWSAAGSQRYLAATKDPYDRWSGNPYRAWSLSIDAAAVEAAWPTIGSLTKVKVTARDGNGAWGGRATTVRITGSKGRVTVAGTTFRSLLGLRSTWFKITS